MFALLLARKREGEEEGEEAAVAFLPFQIGGGCRMVTFSLEPSGEDGPSASSLPPGVSGFSRG